MSGSSIDQPIKSLEKACAQLIKNTEKVNAQRLQDLERKARRDAKAKNDRILKLDNQIQRLQYNLRAAEQEANSMEKYNPIALNVWDENISDNKYEIRKKFYAASKTLRSLPQVRDAIDFAESEIEFFERSMDRAIASDDKLRFITLGKEAEDRWEDIEEKFNDITKADQNTVPDELKDFSKEILKTVKDLITIPTSEEIISQIDENIYLSDENIYLSSRNKSLGAENKNLENENKSLLARNKSLGTENKNLEDENKSLLTSYKSLSDENKNVIDMKDSLAKERDSLKQLNESFKGDKERLIGENQRLISLLQEFNNLPENPSTQKVFPYVNWGKANPSQAWYKDVDWSAVPFKKLSEDEIKGLDWSKINYTQAQSSGSFNINALDWDQINGLSEKLKNKVYKKIDWSKIKFNSMTTGASDVFDWSFVDMKNIPSSPGFTLDVVEIDEIKGTKNFKQLCKVLKKESSSSDGYLAGASDKTLQDIGYENFVGKLTDKKMQEFTTNNGDKYTLVMKPLSYERANAVAKAMGGRLATIDGNESNSFVDKLTGILDQKSVINSLSQTKLNGVSAAWFGYSATDNPRAYTPIKLAELASSGVEDLAIADSTKSLWFIVETEAVTTINSTNFL